MSTVTGHGIAVAAGAGWDVRIFRRPPAPPESTHAVLHAATFALPATIGDYGDGAVDLMSAHDVFVALVEFDPSSTSSALFASRGFPPPFVADDIQRGAVQRAIGEQAGVQRFFSAKGRAWCLYVVVGSYQARASLVDRANGLIAAIKVQTA